MKVLSRPLATIVRPDEKDVFPDRLATRERILAARREAMRLRDCRWVYPPGSIPQHDYCSPSEATQEVECGTLVITGGAVRP